MEQLDTQETEKVVRAIEAATQVKRSYQFFVWLQSHLRSLVPHDLAVCGSYQRDRRDLVMEMFNSVAIGAQSQGALTNPGSALMRHIVARWIDKRAHALMLDLAEFDGAAAECEELQALGFRHLLVHGVARPQRPNELESLFVLTSCTLPAQPRHLAHLELILPLLHATFLRVQATEREVLGSPAAPLAGRAAPGPDGITQRERQILGWIREGHSNQEIGEQLGISALTVKNHVQKILRKLGASNRAHAVAKAMTLNLFDTTPA